MLSVVDRQDFLSWSEQVGYSYFQTVSSLNDLEGRSRSLAMAQLNRLHITS